MAEQRPMFRFRIPWLSPAPPPPPPPPSRTAPPPPPPPPAPKPESPRSVSGPPMLPADTGITPRPQFRPSGISSPPPVRAVFRPQLASPPPTPTRSRAASPSPPQSSLSRAASRSASPPASPPPAPPPLSPPRPPPKVEASPLIKQPSPAVTARHEPPPAPSERVVSEAPRATHTNPNLEEHGKDMGLGSHEEEKKEKGKYLLKGDHKTHKVAKEEKKKNKTIPTPTSQGKNHHHLRGPAGPSLSSSSSSSGCQEPSLQRGIKDDVAKLVQKLTAGHPTEKSELGQDPVHVITLAGENRGASMMISSEPLHDGSVHIHRGYKIGNPDESADPTTDDEDESPVLPSAREEEEEDPAPEAYINSNVQGVNNSIVFEGAVAERNPGVHVTMSEEEEEADVVVGEERGGEVEEEVAGPEARRAEFSPTPAERLTYRPVIKRRCLRGLFMESSDSETDADPAKPRRHGCRYGCGASKRKDKDVIIDM